MKNLLILDTVNRVGPALPKAFRAAGWQVRVTATPPPAGEGKPATAIVLAATAENLAGALSRTLALRTGHTPPVVLLTDLDRSGWDRTFEAPEALDVDALFDLPADADAVLRRVQGLLEAAAEGRTRTPSRGMRAIIDRAVANEAAAADFYQRAAAATAHPETREALLSLARDEEGHKQMLQQFKDGKIRLPETSADAGQILEYMRTPELSTDMSPADAFLLAARKEKLAVEFYRNWAALYAPGPERTLLEQLADIEQQHRVRVEAIFINASFPESW